MVLDKKTRGWWATEQGKFVVRDYEGHVIVFQQTLSETCTAPLSAPTVLSDDPTPTTPPATPATPPSEPPVVTPATPVERVKGNNGWGNGDQAAPGRSHE